VRKQWKVILGLAGVLAAATAVPLAVMAQDPVAVPPPKEKKIAAGEREAKKLLLLMDKDQNGKVSKQEFMGFMEAEFDRLDKDKNGELDVKELTQSQLRSRQAISR
jgi:Ca2+-binding EF-hand superfamily protein